jgi:hypothetical protein
MQYISKTLSMTPNSGAQIAPSQGKDYSHVFEDFRNFEQQLDQFDNEV